jgi:hypothetical protein
MYRATRIRFAAALAAIACLLFSQLAVAAYACPALLHAAAASMPQSADRSDNGNGPCTGHDAARPGLCQFHCNPPELSLNHAQIDAPPVLLVASHPLSESCEPKALASTARPADRPLRSHAPPLSILHCCFRI